MILLEWNFKRLESVVYQVQAFFVWSKIK